MAAFSLQKYLKIMFDIDVLMIYNNTRKVVDRCEQMKN